MIKTTLKANTDIGEKIAKNFLKGIKKADKAGELAPEILDTLQKVNAYFNISLYHKNCILHNEVKTLIKKLKK